LKKPNELNIKPLASLRRIGKRTYEKQSKLKLSCFWVFDIYWVFHVLLNEIENGNSKSLKVFKLAYSESFVWKSFIKTNNIL